MHFGHWYEFPIANQRLEWQKKGLHFPASNACNKWWSRYTLILWFWLQFEKKKTNLILNFIFRFHLLYPNNASECCVKNLYLNCIFNLDTNMKIYRVADFQSLVPPSRIVSQAGTGRCFQIHSSFCRYICVYLIKMCAFFVWIIFNFELQFVHKTIE